MPAGRLAAVLMRALTLAQNKPGPAKTLCDTS